MMSLSRDSDTDRLRTLITAVHDRWRENDIVGVGIALARLEEHVGLRDRGDRA